MHHDASSKREKFSYQLGDLELRVQRAANTKEEARAIHVLLRFYDRLFAFDQDCWDWQVAESWWGMLAQRRFDAPLWHWLKGCCFTRNQRHRAQLASSILVIIPDPPVTNSDLLAMWQFWWNKKLRWVFVAVYGGRPEAFLKHFRKVRRLAHDQVKWASCPESEITNFAREHLRRPPA